jgi:FkbM family methyltransferase
MLSLFYTSRVRDLARAAGLVELLQLPMRWRNHRREAAFRRSPVSEEAIALLGHEVWAKVADAGEYRRVHATADDGHLLAALAPFAVPGGVYWDIGANIGLYAIAFAKMMGGHGRVVVFEPEAGSRARLLENLMLNDVTTADVQPMALGAAEGEAQLAVSKAAYSGTHSLVRVPDDATSETITVRIISGDALVEQGVVPAPTFIKVDVEGYEEFVIDGLKQVLAREQVHGVLVEVHFRILSESGQPDAPKRIQRKLDLAGLTNQSWLDASHLLAKRP